MVDYYYETVDEYYAPGSSYYDTVTPYYEPIDGDDVTTFTGDGTSTAKDLDTTAETGTLKVYAVMGSRSFANVITWLEDIHYTVNPTGQNYITSISPVTTWPAGVTFYCYYVKY